MMTERIPRALHLLWALPIAIAAQYFSYFWARICWCGLQECSPRYDYSPMVGQASGFVIFGAVVATVVLILAPWTKARRVRLTAGPVYAIAVAVAILTGLIVDSAS